MNKVLQYLLLITAVIAFGSAASAFLSLGDEPPPMKAAWRMQITALAQVIPSIYDWYTSPESCKLMVKKYIYMPMFSGFCLGIHFTLWNLSLDITSMAHSLLFVCSGPVMIVLGSFVILKRVRKADTIGVVLGMIGMLLVSFDYSRSDSKWYGDLIALAACLGALIYLLNGKKALNSLKFPLWSYLMLVNTFASLFSLMLSGLIYDDWRYFGWMTRDKAGYTVFLGIAPGFFGHTTINYLTKSLRPVIITAFVNLEPLFGSIIGWFMGYQAIPGYFTWIGGVVMIIGNLIITVFEAKDAPKKELITDLDVEEVEKHQVSLLINELVESEPQL